MVNPMTAVPSAQVATVSRAGELSLTLLGATGSIGSSTLDLVRKNRDRFRVEAVTAQRSAAALAKLARDVGARLAVVGDESCYGELKDALGNSGIEAAAGEEAIVDAARRPAEWVMAAITGAAGLRPTMTALERGATIALANKECLVCAGALFMRRAQEIGAIVLPVDSEHNAIFQALSAGRRADVSRIILTASGGPFRTASLEQMRAATVQQALRHPNWSMGAKITIDSATLMNKGLEMIEAKWLFNLQPGQVQVVIHPQSIIHSMIQFEDGSIKAQMGLPDMKLPIQYALAFPRRIASSFPRYDFRKPGTLTFEEPDVKTFRNLTLATEALFKGGNLPCVLNAANEIAVFAFLRNRIGFLDMTDLVERTMQHVPFIEHPTLEEYFESDGEALNFAASLIKL